MKKFFKVCLMFVFGFAIIIGGYVAYLYLSYHRLADNIKLRPQNHQETALKTGTTYKAMTFNIGYAAYPASYSFFMDGGKYSRAYSRQSVEQDMAGITKAVKEENPTLAFFSKKLIRMPIVHFMSTKLIGCSGNSLTIPMFMRRTMIQLTCFIHSPDQSEKLNLGW
ncbi:hypothetical protein [Lentilactobacillus rapi]|uniref:hypothetical protein n=1 Tax=Lentilactobacillus rapi TaxID=481723 RepID=UPI000A75790F|nr:hypothetical protein [Lentilactobacillus rapi]